MCVGVLLQSNIYIIVLGYGLDSSGNCSVMCVASHERNRQGRHDVECGHDAECVFVLSGWCLR